MLSQKLLKKFKEIWKKELQSELADFEAQEEAEKLLNLYRATLGKPFTSDNNQNNEGNK